MSTILHVDAWQLGVGFFLLMLGTWWIGVFVGRKVRAEGGDQSTRIEDASIALFALLLAFSFSGAASRYENRKGFLLDEAIAIGDFAATASMLENPLREQIRRELLAYTRERLAFGQVHIDDPRMAEVTARSRDVQQRILASLHDVVTGKQSPTLHAPLMNGFNGITMTHDRALYGSQDQVADTIIIMLIVFGLVSAFMMGRLAREHGKRVPPLTRALIYIALVTTVFTVTMDLEQPHRGIMRGSRAPLFDLLASLQHP